MSRRGIGPQRRPSDWGELEEVPTDAAAAAHPPLFLLRPLTSLLLLLPPLLLPPLGGEDGAPGTFPRPNINKPRKKSKKAKKVQ